jgi:hypothetical protein
MAYILSFSPLSFSSSAHYEPVCLAGVGVGCAGTGPARTVNIAGLIVTSANIVG